MSLRHCVSTALRSPHVFQGGLSVAANKNFSTEIIEKAEELKLSYLTGERQGVAVIELNREIGKNSLSKSLVKKLLHSVDVLGNDKGVRVVVVRSLSEFQVQGLLPSSCTSFFLLNSQRHLLRWSGFERTTDDVTRRSETIR